MEPDLAPNARQPPLLVGIGRPSSDNWRPTVTASIAGRGGVALIAGNLLQSPAEHRTTNLNLSL